MRILVRMVSSAREFMLLQANFFASKKHNLLAIIVVYIDNTSFSCAATMENRLPRAFYHAN